MIKFSFAKVLNGILALVGLLFGFYILNSLIDLKLTNHFQQPLALIDFNYFLHDLKYPAGMSNYAGLAMSDLWGIPYLGVLVTLCFIIIIPVIEYVRLKQIGKSPFAMALSLSIFILLLVVFVDYYINAGLFFSFLFSYLFFLLTRFIANQIKKWFVLVLLLIPIIILVYITSGIAGLALYTLLSVLLLLKSNSQNFPKMLIIGAMVLFAALTPILLSVMFYPLITIPAAFTGNFVLFKTSVIYYITLLVILALNIFIIEGQNAKPYKFNGWIPLSISSLVFLFIWIGPTLRFDKEKKLRIEIDYLAYTQNWDALLKKAQPQLMHERKMAFQINRALYFTGGLLENLFMFPQYLGNSSLLLEKNTDDDVLIPASDIYYDMGYLNESRHWANESLTRYGKEPRILKRLTQINIVYGNYNGAKKYIELLKKTYSHKKWAIEQEQYLFDEAKVLQNSEYATLIKQIPKKDFFATKSAPQLNLVNMNNFRESKMVFEYLMAFTLLEHNIARLVKNIEEFKMFNYEKLPGNVEQALGIYMAMTHAKSIQMDGYQFSKSFYDQFKDYSETYVEFNKGVAGSKNKLEQKYGNTFWYYIHFISPNAKH